MVKMETPEFPLRIEWIETGEVEYFESLTDIERNVEEIDTAKKQTRVFDGRGRPVRLRVVALNTEVCELEV
jgi:hypothetical protein